MKTVGIGQKAAERRAWLPWGGALALAILVANSAIAAEPNLTVSVRVYNYAKVPSGVLVHGEREASRVFAAAGVDTTWVDCLAPQIRAVSAPAPARLAETANSDCDAPAGQVTVGLRILNASTIRNKDFSDEMFGFATGSDWPASSTSASKTSLGVWTKMGTRVP